MKYLIVDPYFFHKIIGHPLDQWMRLYGKDRYAKEYNPTKRAEVSVVRLWMVTLEKKELVPQALANV